MQLAEIVRPLLQWYEKNARSLPWRENTDPYRVWISEIMLQQTRVETVKPYFERFVQTFPTVHSLAQADTELLLKCWEGLGYYTRARNLLRAAQRICSEYNGTFPQQYDQILALPGIGPYTAGAICSIAFEQPTPAVDGNVLRVTARLTESEKIVSDSSYKAHITALLREIYPQGKCGTFTQSLMDLGAMICLPGTPDCDNCPLQDCCEAKQHGTQGIFPRLLNKKARKVQNITVYLLYTSDKIALCKRPDKGLLRGLWQLPNHPGSFSEEKLAQLIPIYINIAKPIQETHIFTHIQWNMTVYPIFCKDTSAPFVWVTPQQIQQEFPLPTAFRKLLKYVPT